jgi:hypothetical protein
MLKVVASPPEKLENSPMIMQKFPIKHNKHSKLFIFKAL